MGVTIAANFGSEELPSPSDPMAVARVLLKEYLYDATGTLRHWRGGWMRWESSHWAEIEQGELSAAVYKRLEGAEYLDMSGKDPKIKPWEPNRRKVGEFLDAIRALTHLPESVNPPVWLDREKDGSIHRAGELVACQNGLLDVGTRELISLTPRYFNRVAVPFDYDADAPSPTRWLEFLDQLWPNDPDSIAAMREFFGYVLSGRTDLHKIMLLIGPTRSGKGTIARVLSALVGRGNAAGPTLASLGTNFGLSPLLGKPLAVVSDARLGGANVHQVVERLLSVSGEDMLTVDRKYREPWTGKLPTRFIVLSNELPRFGDASGAIANRFIVLSMSASFLGKENTKLTDELLAELPGILRWTLDGLDRISTGSFTTPTSSLDAITALQDLVSPVAAFVRDRCTVGPYEAPVSALYNDWRVWCEDSGHRPGSTQTFGRDLRAVIPQLRVTQPRDGQSRERHYVGLTLSTTHNGDDRVPSRANDQNEDVARDGTRTNPLWATCSKCHAKSAELVGVDSQSRPACRECAVDR